MEKPENTVTLFLILVPPLRLSCNPPMEIKKKTSYIKKSPSYTYRLPVESSLMAFVVSSCLTELWF
ncbi:UNVERIFIED_CONTAM: hypothetical protein NCL1_21557 [Trichonephila clavipes]